MPSTRRLAVTTLGTLELLQCEDVLDDARCRQSRHLAEDQHGGAPESEALRVTGKLGNGRENATLILAAGILDREHREIGPEARLEQFRGDEARRGHAHIDEKRILAGGKRSEIEMLEARLLAAGLVARQEGHGVRDVAMGERNL